MASLSGGKSSKKRKLRSSVADNATSPDGNREVDVERKKITKSKKKKKTSGVRGSSNRSIDRDVCSFSFDDQWQSRFRHVREMFAARGYEAPEQQVNHRRIGSIVVPEMCTSFANPRKGGGREFIRCLWIPFSDNKHTSSMKKSDVESCCDRTGVPVDHSLHLIVITNSASFQAVSHLVASENTYFEILSYSDVSFRVHEHYLVPKYTVLGEEDVAAVVKRYGDLNKFNKIVATEDAVARYLDFRRGDVLRLDKHSSISGTSISYRVVVEGHSVV